MKLKKEIEIEIPTGPNFRRMKSRGFTSATQQIPGFNIEEFTDAELRQIGNLWTDYLIERARKKRKDKK